MDLDDVVITGAPLIFDPGAMASSHDGAMVAFFGMVRDSTDGRSVIGLEYEAYDRMAEQQLRLILATARSRWEVGRTLIHHRTGPVQVGQCSVIIAVTAPHRQEAFEACRFCIEELKSNAAIWKKELFSDGSFQWIQHG